MTTHRVGYGAGTAMLPGQANGLATLTDRWQLHDTSRDAVTVESDLCDVIGTNIDGRGPPNKLADVTQRIIARRCPDVWQPPCVMKKGGDWATRVGAICAVRKPRLMQNILLHNSTIGIGVQVLQRQQNCVFAAPLKSKTPTGPGPEGNCVDAPRRENAAVLASKDDEARRIASDSANSTGEVQIPRLRHLEETNSKRAAESL